MSLTRRGKATLAAAVVVVLALAAGGYFAVFPNKAPAFVRSAMSRVGLARPAPPT